MKPTDIAALMKGIAPVIKEEINAAIADELAPIRDRMTALEAKVDANSLEKFAAGFREAINRGDAR